MSVAAHHNDWLSLVEVSGPFLELPVLVDALPGGLDKADRGLTVDLWHAHAEWIDDDRGGAPDPAVHRAWARYVAERLLGYESDVLVDDTDALEGWSVEVPEHDASLRATLAVSDPGATDDPPLLLIDVIPPDIAVLESSSGTGWSASPAERMEALLKATEVRLGLVTNGEQWTLVHVAEGENTGFATWYASLWREEPLTLRAFTTLLGMQRFFAVAEHETLQALLDRSREDQQGVTTQLGKQVRRAIEILIQQIDRVDHDRDGRLLEGMTDQRLYEAAVTVMMRLIFLFYAEENDLLLLGDEFYDETYAASTLREQLQATADENGEEILERFHDAWPRLLSTFRAVYAGVEHEQMRLPEYGGALFDPDRYPFLEGREPETSWEADPANPLPIDNRTVLHLLNAIQTLEVKVPGGGRENRPLSFRALDVEQIGHVYETLLDHAAKRADDWVFGLEGTRDKEPEIPLRELEDRVDDTKELIEYLRDETGRSAGALKKRVAAEEKAVYERWGHRWKPAFGGHEESAAVATKWGLLVREDSAESPVVVPPGHVYVTESEQRRSSGTHYTPRSLTEEIVAHTLEPLVYEGPADGRDRSDWERRRPEQILDLKVCDPACGSGAFLVQACRYLAERLVEAWEEHSSTEGPDGHALPVDPEERLIVARRYVADRCLYGVDINPLATEMAKLSLWLITLQKNRPFTFLDHAIRPGDSLLGVTDFETLETFGVAKGQTQLWSQSWAPHLKAAREAREELRAFSVIDAKDALQKQALLDHAKKQLGVLAVVADVTSGIALTGAAMRKSDFLKLRDVWGTRIAEELQVGEEAHQTRTFSSEVADLLTTEAAHRRVAHRPFHWALEFPEVFSEGGFDAVLGNPPYLGGTRISEELGDTYNRYLANANAPSSRTVDQVVYFFRRALSILSDRGTVGLVTTPNLVSRANRMAGLRFAVSQGFRVFRARSKAPWPGAAGTSIIRVWLSRMSIHPTLDGVDVPEINSLLRAMPESVAEVKILTDSEERCCLGSRIMGDPHFRLSRETAVVWLSQDPRYAEVLKPYVGGEDVNGDPNERYDGYVVDFGDLSLSAAQEYSTPFHFLSEGARRYRLGLDPNAYPRAVSKWWQFFHPRHEIKASVQNFGLSRLIARARVASYHFVDFVRTDAVFNDKVVLFFYETDEALGILQSHLHEAWAEVFSSRMGVQGVLSYTPSSAAYTFPLDTDESVRLARCAKEFLSSRARLVSDTPGGLTSAMARVHRPTESGPCVSSVRDALEELELAVLEHYGWTDLKPKFDLRGSEFGMRFRPVAQYSREVIGRLAELNSQWQAR